LKIFLFSIYKRKKRMTDTFDTSGTPDIYVGYHAQLFSLLSHDRSLYTSLLPREIIHLVLNYTTTRTFVFGSNKYGQMGLGNIEPQYIPVELNHDVKDLAFGDHHTLLLTHDGQLYINGSNNHFQFGINRLEEPHLHDRFNNISLMKSDTLNGQKIIKIAAGSYHSCILTDKNNCYTFGDNKFGQLGHSGPKSVGKWYLVASDVIDIACGNNHTCYLSKDHQVYVFGANTFGELGLSRSIDKVFKPTHIQKFSNVTKIFASWFNTAFVNSTSDGDTLYVCGSNQYGQLNGGYRITNTPKDIVDEFDQLIVDVQKVCFTPSALFILANSTLYVCGQNRKRSLGIPGIKRVPRLRIHEQFLGQNVTDIATSNTAAFVVADKICYRSGRLTTDTTEPKLAKFTPMEMFTETFVNNIDLVRVQAGYHSAGLTIV
jgi:alpha-tubulin suppressor-like RCC1 family protein